MWRVADQRRILDAIPQAVSKFWEKCDPDTRSLDKPGSTPWSLSVLRTFAAAGVSGFLADRALLPADPPASGGSAVAEAARL